MRASKSKDPDRRYNYLVGVPFERTVVARGIRSRTTSPHILDAVLWWHLLSLDAPTVAAVWTWFIGRTAHVSLPWTAPAAMFLGVWILYASDRLLDARAEKAASQTPTQLEARHHFHGAHRNAFFVAIAIAAAALLPMLITMPRHTLALYCLLGVLQIAWFVLIHRVARGESSRLPKEFAVGIFFAAAVFLPTVSRMPSLRLSLLPAAAAFACLCSLNCIFIFAWEHRELQGASSAHRTTRLALRFLEPIALSLTLLPIVLALVTRSMPWQVAAALSLASALLLVLDRLERVLGQVRLRAIADLVLLTPLLVIAFWP